MAFLVTAGAPSGWPLYAYFRAITTAVPDNGTGLTTVTLDNDAPLNALDRRIILTGTNLSVAGGIITGGTITSIRITGLTGSPTFFTFTVTHALLAADFHAAINAFVSSGHTDFSALDAIFNPPLYEFTGGTGDDFFTGRSKDDELTGGRGDDVLFGNNGNDTINGGDGDDILDGGDGDDTLIGGKGDDWITTGFGGKNLVDGGEGADTITFQGDADTLTFANAKKAVGVDLDQGLGFLGEALYDTYVLFAANGLTVIGSKFNDVLLGSIHADTLEGGLGNDILMGRGGADTLDGGLGIDTASYAESPSFGGVGVIIDLTLPNQIGSPGHGTGDILISIENLIGSDYGDELSGDANPNRLEGGAGNDFLEGRGGADVLLGGDGWDTARYGDSDTGVTVDLNLKTAQKSAGHANGDILSGIEAVVGSLHGDVLYGANNVDNWLFGNDGDDILFGGRGGTNELYGDGGSDTVDYTKATKAVEASLTAAQGQWNGTVDLLFSIENLTGSNFNDLLTGDGLANTIKGGNGHDRIFGKGGDNVLHGDNGNDFLFGGDDADEIDGGAGKDFLDGGSGNDTLTGGLGRDVFVTSAGSDTVTDFKAGAGGDYLDLRVLGLAGMYQAFQMLSQVGNDTIVDLGGGNEFILQNVDMGNMTAVNFIIR